MRLATGVLAAAGLVTGCSSGLGNSATEVGRTADAPAAYLAGTESRIMSSSRTGRTYQISIALPRGYATSSRRYPALYSLDANGEFGLVVETARLLRLEDLLPELVIVGIGYPVGHYFDAIGKRALDLTVSEDPTWDFPPNAPPDLPRLEGTGGARAFLQFVIEELVPALEREYRVNPGNRALLGHSFGGLFAFYALLHGQGAFHRFVISSPALWWDDRVSFKHENQYSSANQHLPARAFFSAGLLEPTEDMPSGGYVRDLRELAAIFERRGYRDFHWTAHFFEGEFHTSVLPPAVSRGLRYIYGTR